MELRPQKRSFKEKRSAKNPLYSRIRSETYKQNKIFKIYFKGLKPQEDLLKILFRGKPLKRFSIEKPFKCVPVREIPFKGLFLHQTFQKRLRFSLEKITLKVLSRQNNFFKQKKSSKTIIDWTLENVFQKVFYRRKTYQRYKIV